MLAGGFEVLHQRISLALRRHRLQHLREQAVGVGGHHQVLQAAMEARGIAFGDQNRMLAKLALEDGTVFTGRAIGALAAEVRVCAPSTLMPPAIERMGVTAFTDFDKALEAVSVNLQFCSLVINYDLPDVPETYVHRIGRTGRAGRTGDAILFIAPRERKLLMNIEKATKQKVEEMGLPSTEVINNKRIARFKQNITDTLAAEELSFFSQLIEQYQCEHNVSALEIASALAKLVQGDTPLLMQNPPKKAREPREEGFSGNRDRGEARAPRERGSRRDFGGQGIEMELFRIEVGHVHGVKPGNIVGAIANEAGIDGKHIARINIEDTFSTVELPAGMPKELIQDLRKVLKLSRLHSLSLEGRLQQSLDEHRLIMAALAASDAPKAEKLMHDHLLSGREALAKMDAKSPKAA